MQVVEVDVGEPLAEDHSQHAPAVSNGVEVAYAVDPGILEAGNLHDLKPRLVCANGDLRVGLEVAAGRYLGPAGEKGAIP